MTTTTSPDTSALSMGLMAIFFVGCPMPVPDLSKQCPTTAKHYLFEGPETTDAQDNAEFDD